MDVKLSAFGLGSFVTSAPRNDKLYHYPAAAICFTRGNAQAAGRRSSTRSFFPCTGSATVNPMFSARATDA